jgi:hypothetical protein
MSIYHYRDSSRATGKPELMPLVRTLSDAGPEVLVLYPKRPRWEDWELRRRVWALQIQRLKEAAPRDYGICIWMGRS